MGKSKAKVVTIDFDYDRKQWIKIEQCICAVRSSGSSEEERTRLRKAAIEYLSDKRQRENGSYASPKRRAVSWKKVARICDELKNEIGNALESRYGARRDELDHPVHPLKYGDAELTFGAVLDVLAELKFGAEEFSKPLWWGVSIFKTSTGRLDPSVVYLQSILLMWKEDFCGELKISRDPNSGQIGGPLARYIDAVATPVMGPAAPSPNSYRSLINRQKALYRRWEEIRRMVGEI
jgi:hypothetical protein